MKNKTERTEQGDVTSQNDLIALEEGPRGGSSNGNEGNSSQNHPESLSTGSATMNAIFERTDVGNALRIVYHHGKELRYCPEMRSWFYWSGRQWVQDNEGYIERVAKIVPAHIEAEARSFSSSNAQKDYRNWAHQSQSKQRIDAMIALARSEIEVVVLARQLDSNPMLLNVLNGTLDLETCELRQHDPADLITKMAPVEYDPEAECPKWLEFLRRIMNGDQEMITFLQQAIGYSLTGLTSPQVMFFCYGLGANGKTTFLETIRDMLGDYAQKAPRGMLEAQQYASIPNDLARLPGARFVVSNELSANKPLDEALIKDLTGGDTIVARFLHKEYFEFTPTHKLWVYGNHKPRIEGTDEGIWRRVLLIPFTVTIPKEEQRASLRKELGEELSGILAWAVRGLRDVYQGEIKIKRPEQVKLASDEYRQENDIVGQFMEERCELKALCQVAINDLYYEYELWCILNDEEPVTKLEFGKKLSERGLKKRRTNAHRLWIGIRLKADRQAVNQVVLAPNA